jgi:ArsR family transcriptional regulator, arsenate/arsenite/antimonite-responsive transcriptional repressor / arsenate reductase (thioredoxin)
MNAERNGELLRARARVHAALGEPARLAIVDRLLLGDASPSEIGRELGLPSNLLAHHLKLLEQAGVLERSRSEGDHRRTYLRLRADTLAGLQPAELRAAPRVVFVCTHNSARSQLAAALWKKRSRVPAASAGTQPAGRVHPRAVAIARRHGLGLARAHTAHVDDVLRTDDLVIAVCDNAHEELHGPTGRLHWSVPDPVRVGTDEAFESAYHELTDRIGRLVPVVHKPGDQS